MDAKTTSTNINNFEPLSDIVNEGDCDTLLVYLPGFTREQLRVQLARSGVLKISGTRPLGDNKWSSFHKDFPVTVNCDTSKITAKFEDGVLYVRQPKLIVPDKKPETPHASTKTNHEEPHETTPDKPTTKDHEPKATSESSAEGTKKSDNTPEKTAGGDVPGKDGAELENKGTESNYRDNHIANDKLSEGTKKSDNTPEKTAGSARGDNVPGKDVAELENKGTESNYRDDHIANDKLSEGYKMAAEAKLKVARQKTTMVLVVLFAFALGMFISKLQAWFSREDNY